MRTLATIFLSLLMFSFSGNSQTINETIKAAEKEFESGNFYAAADLYSNALSKNPNLRQVRYQYAEALRMSKDYKKASSIYRKIATDCEEEYPLSRFWYAEMLKYQGDYKRASAAYLKFYKSFRTFDELKYFILKARYEKEVCEMLAIEPVFQEPIGLSLLDTMVNSVYGEFSPFEIDSANLVFSSFRSIEKGEKSIFQSGIFISREGQDSIKAQMLDTGNLVDGFHYSVSPGLAPREVFITRCPINLEDGFCEIYLSDFYNDSFSELRKLKGGVNMPGSNSRHPFLTRFKNQEFLLFSSDRPGGFGRHDIWYCQRRDSLNFEDGKNAGEIINSIDDEITPFYYPGDTLLYFSSTWHKSYGGFDIFQSAGDFTKWETPTNLGRPINSSYDDLYYSFNTSSRNAYFVSNRPGGLALENETCCNDIYSYPLPWSANDSLREQQRIIAYQKRIEQNCISLRLLTPLELYFPNDLPDPKSQDTTTNANYAGIMEVYLQQQEKYMSVYSRGLKRNKKQDAEDEILNLFMDDIEGNWNKLELFCQLAEDLILHGKTIALTIKAYTSPLNNAEYNKKLAKRRIASLMNYFAAHNNGSLIHYIENGSLRINTIAFGESESSGKISDDLRDKRNSIYSPAAARARKITIEAVEIK